MCFQALLGWLKPTTDPETLSKDHKGMFWSVRGKIGPEAYSHHGGNLSVMMMVGICQWQNPTIDDDDYD